MHSFQPLPTSSEVSGWRHFIACQERKQQEQKKKQKEKECIPACAGRPWAAWFGYSGYVKKELELGLGLGLR